ncbi:MAG: hypothetical protein IJH54_01990 [Clostridia bacterium]|nr:hypothetical protein [Clostridia bacterium]
MKRILIGLLAVLLMLTVACNKGAAAQTVVGADEPLAGGWTPAEDSSLTEERLAIFEKGMAALLGVDYVPLAYLGSQVVAGTNHVFLVKGTMVVPTQPVSYALAYLYEDLQGGVQILTIADLPIVPQEDGTLALPEEGLMGGWHYAEDPAFTDEDEAKLEGALQNQVGASYTIVAYVGEQVVAGLNRCLLVQVTPVVPDARPHYALAYVYTDLQGESTLTEVMDLDVGSLCTYGA